MLNEDCVYFDSIWDRLADVPLCYADGEIEFITACDGCGKYRRYER